MNAVHWRPHFIAGLWDHNPGIYLAESNARSHYKSHVIGAVTFPCDVLFPVECSTAALERDRSFFFFWRSSCNIIYS